MAWRKSEMCITKEEHIRITQILLMIRFVMATTLTVPLLTQLFVHVIVSI